MIDAYPVKPHAQFVAEDGYAILAKVEKGLGLSVVPELILQRTPYRVVAKELESAAHRDVGIAFRMDALSLAARRFLSYVERWMDRGPAG